MDFFNTMIDSLRQGISAEELAKQFTDALNNATKAYEQERREAQQKEEFRLTLAQDIMTAFNTYITAVHPGSEFPLDQDVKTFADSLDELIKDYKSIEGYLNNIKGYNFEQLEKEITDSLMRLLNDAN